MRFGQRGTAGEVFRTALKLGLTSFGGPVAHIGYFRQEYVARRQWLDDRTFADLTALCQFLPGPASSQLGMAIGLGRAGTAGALAAWLGFTLPSAIVMALFALLVGSGAAPADGGWLHGLKLAAVAVVVQAVWSMGRSLAADRPRLTMALLAAAFAAVVPGVSGQLVPLALCAAAGLVLFGREDGGRPADANAAADGESAERPAIARRRTAILLLALFALLLFALPLLARAFPSTALAIADSHYRAGSLVFGGGHVVLPMLEKELEASSALDVPDDAFMAGYGLAQAMPGPLFTFAAYVGGVSGEGPGAILLAAAALFAIFVPSYLLLAGALPFWERLRRNRRAQAALAGVNAGVVGVLLAALYDPVWTGTVGSGLDFAFAAAAFLLLHVWRLPPWAVVAASAAAGWALWPV